jgi:hypothetical protein
MISILCPIVAVVVNVVTQILVFRHHRGAHYFRSIAEGFFAGAAFLAVAEIILTIRGGAQDSPWVVPILVNTPIYLALSYCAYNFIQLGQTSIRLRMYSEIASQAAGVSVEEMKREYDDNAMMQARLRRLIESGDILERDGRYVVGRSRLVLISNILVIAKRIMLGKSSEFE